MVSILKKLFGTGPDVNFKELKNKGALIVDVRTSAEFNSGHIKDALNVPLDTISSQVQMIKKRNKPVIVVCASGIRSGMAVKVLTREGIEAYNGGAWKLLKGKLA